MVKPRTFVEVAVLIFSTWLWWANLDGIFITPAHEFVVRLFMPGSFICAYALGRIGRRDE